MEPLYTTGETAAILNLGIRTITRYARQLGGKKFGNVWRFLPEVIERARREGVRRRSRPEKSQAQL